MSDLTATLLAGFTTADSNISMQIPDLRNEDAVRRARGDRGASISFLLGHLLDFRCNALAACGVPVENKWNDRFGFPKEATDGSDYPDIHDLHADWKSLHAQLCEALAGVSDDRLREKSGMPGPFAEMDVHRVLAFFMWHEAYHVGGIGLLRAQWGYRRTHEVALEGMGEQGEQIREHARDRMTTAPAAIADAYYRGWETKDRDAILAAVTPDLSFRSPMDDFDSAGAFLDNCLEPFGGMPFTFTNRVFTDSDGWVAYTVPGPDGTPLLMSEHLQFRDGRIAAIRVYFGQKQTGASD